VSELLDIIIIAPQRHLLAKNRNPVFSKIKIKQKRVL
jgi:hypothetical protein